MTCWIFKHLIPLFIGGDLPDALTSRISRHLARCDACAVEYRALRASWNAVKQAARKDLPPPLSADFAARVRREIAAQPEEKLSPFYTRPAVLAWAAAAVLVIAGLSLLREHPAVTSSDRAVEAIAEGVSSPSVEIAEEDTAKTSPALLASLMSRINPNRNLTDRELDAKYPIVESLTYPQGTQVIYHAKDPNVKIVWVLTPKGGRVQ